MAKHIMRMLVRVLAGFVGCLGLAVALTAWLRPESIAGSLGLVITNPTGLATIRADIGGFFGASGIFAVLAAVHGRPQYVLAALLLQCFAIAGRLVNIAFVGWSFNFLTPISIEAVVIALFFMAYRTLATTDTFS